MTMSEAIATVNERNPNAFPEETKAKILCAFESRLVYEFEGEDRKISYPENINDELILPGRYSEIYVVYLSAMVYFWNKEYEEYNNHAALFSSLMEQYRDEHGAAKKNERKRFFNLF